MGEQWCFGIVEPTKSKARKRLFEKIGRDAYKWRFEFKRIEIQKTSITKRGNVKMSNIESTNVTTGEVRLSFVNLFTPRANQPGQDPRYSTTILIPKSDTATMQRIQAAIQAAVQKGIAGVWGGAAPAQPRTPIHDGDGLRPNGEPFGEECKGHWVMTASSKQQQQVVDLNLNPIIDQTEVYSGMYARVNINFFPYSNSGNKGIGAGLGPVQKLRDGEPLGGRITAEQAFGGSPVGVGYAQPSHNPPAGGEHAAPQQGYAAPSPQQGHVPSQQPPVQPGFATSQQQPQIDPITGKPLQGGVYGI